MNVHALLAKCAQFHGPRIALEELESRRAWTFTELHTALTQVRAALDAMGIAPQDRVALLGSSEAADLLCDYGVMAADRVRVPLDPGLRSDEQAAQLLDAGARLLIHDAAHAERAAELARLVPGMMLSAQQALLERPAPAAAADALAAAMALATTLKANSPLAMSLTKRLVLLERRRKVLAHAEEIDRARLEVTNSTEFADVVERKEGAGRM